MKGLLTEMWETSSPIGLLPGKSSEPENGLLTGIRTSSGSEPATGRTIGPRQEMSEENKYFKISFILVYSLLTVRLIDAA